LAAHFYNAQLFFKQLSPRFLNNKRRNMKTNALCRFAGGSRKDGKTINTRGLSYEILRDNDKDGRKNFQAHVRAENYRKR
jgi:hypothetical protein